ncbi:LuxR C-terminal-related transcriptional regulator [Streptomyces sp. NPDC085932]|uniref:LuxR family transcriptional regulator AbsR2 n=1 Tax=Streptomyces sp. NPDC085932 TaxID=3365741 RepID=UPI0037CEBA4E
MTTYQRDATTLELPWPFAGREDELELVRRSLTGSRRGIVVTGPAGCGRTRLVTEAVRGTDCARAAGTPESRSIPFAAFAHLLPEPVTLHRAVQLLAGVRTLLVDDAHLLDDASATLVHQLAVDGRVRLLVVATDGAPVPGAISRLWTGELLPRLTLERLSEEATAQLLTAGAGPLDPLTVRRLQGLARGDLRLLRELLGAVRTRLTPVPETGERAWRGPVPLTPAVRERTAHVLGRTCPRERETLDRLAFAEPLPSDPDGLDLAALEVLESDGLVHVDDTGAVRLAHPLYGPVLRAAAGRLRARRLVRSPREHASALDAERAALARRIEEDDVRATPAPVGEWLVAEGDPLPGRYAAVRARFARLRGEVREAAAWAREGLRGDPGDASCRAELARAGGPSGSGGDLDTALADLADPYDAVRLGTPEKVIDRLSGVFARHADALTRADGPALDEVAGELERRGFTLFAAEAHAQAVGAHRDPRAARHSRARAVALARRCEGARTPALAGLALGELTARQRQIVALAAAGLSNRQIAERLTLSIRTVGNHLYSAYARLGASDRASLPWLTDTPEAA